MTPEEKYLNALKKLFEAQKEVQASSSNPFDLGMPTHLGLSSETFISESQLDVLVTKIDEAAADNRKFARLWNIGTDILIKAKVLILQ
jgi:hypothetical protein